MPCITLPIDPILGPTIEIGISAAAALRNAGAGAPAITWIKAVADTGCSHTSIYTDVAVAAGLKVISKNQVNTPAGPVGCDMYLGDIFIKVPLPNGHIYEYGFPNRGISQLIAKLPGVDALLGMDMFNLGTFHVNGITKNAMFCW